MACFACKAPMISVTASPRLKSAMSFHPGGSRPQSARAAKLHMTRSTSMAGVAVGARLSCCTSANAAGSLPLPRTPSIVLSGTLAANAKPWMKIESATRAGSSSSLAHRGPMTQCTPHSGSDVALPENERPSKVSTSRVHAMRRTLPSAVATSRRDADSMLHARFAPRKCRSASCGHAGNKAA